MIIVATRSAHHLLTHINVSVRHPEIHLFSDGELSVKVHANLSDEQSVCVLASTQAPAENILELLFLLDALHGIGVKKINIFLTYFGYARQAVAKPGYAHSAKLMCQWLQQFPLNTVYIMHPHAPNVLESFMPFTPIIPMDFFCAIAQKFDCVAAPDKGAVDVAHAIATSCKKELIFMEKTRTIKQDITITTVNGNVVGKKILLVDDMICSGQTITKAAQALLAQGAASISAAATHGVFSAHAIEHINASVLEKVYVTNTLPVQKTEKIVVHDINENITSILEKKGK